MKNRKTKPRLLILGSGYLGERVAQFGADQFEVVQTSRTSSKDIQFDLHNAKTWENIPFVEYCLWTFPAEPLSDVKKFLTQKGDIVGQILAIGSTGSLVPESENQKVNEDSPRDLEQARVLGENQILEFGGSVLLSAGIYGPNRDPRDWVRRGLVGPSDRLLNLIHVEDLARLSLAVFEIGLKSELLVASDGNPHKWSDLMEYWRQKFGIESPQSIQKPQRISKRVDPSRTLLKLGVELGYPDLKEALS